MKKLTYTAALLTATLFAATASAGSDNAEDILHGNGAVTASEATPYVLVNSGPNGTDSDLLSNLETLSGASRFVPYQRISDDRDHRDNLLDSAS